MVDGVRTFDPVGAFQRGRRGQQAIAAEAAAAPRRNLLADLQLEQAQVGAQRGETQFGQQQALQRATILGQSAQALKGLPLDQRDAAFAAISPQLQRFDIDPAQFPPGSFTDVNLDSAIAQSQAFIGSGGDPFTLGQGQQRFDAQGRPIAQVAPKPTAFQLKPGEQRFEDGRVVATGAPLAPTTTPPALLADLDPIVAAQADAAFVAAGGGKDGVKALGKVIDSAGEQQRRLSSPKILKQNFPKASGAELQQLQATMDAAKTTESGLTSAQKVRTEQIRLKKGKEFQARAIELLQGILENPELADVIGGQEGTGEGFFFGKQILSDLEADAVSDIEEATSILTSGNLDLLSGVLSDTDIGLLKDLSSGALKRIRSEPRFRADVQKLIEKLSSKLVVTVDDTAQDRAQTEVTPRSGRQGGTLMTDSQGNRAFVFPDGTFEEVQ